MFDVNTFDLAKYDSILSRGLSSGLGESDGQMCIEAAICATLGLPHGDDPECVASSVRSFKIALNDQQWSSPQARSEGLYDLGIAQLGTKDVVDNTEFRKRLAEKIIRQLIPKLFREVFPTNETCLNAALRCETEGTSAAAYAAAAAANTANEATEATNADSYRVLAAKLALEVLIELESPGTKLLGKKEKN